MFNRIYLVLCLVMVGCGLVIVDPSPSADAGESPSADAGESPSPDAGVDASTDAALCLQPVDCCSHGDASAMCVALCWEAAQAPACIPGVACVEPGMICVPPGSTPWYP